MVTKNFKQFLASLLQYSTSVGTTGIRMQDVYGYMRYASGRDTSSSTSSGNYVYDFPQYVYDTYTLNRFDAGISIGRGSTPPTEEDWNLEDTVSSGVLIQKVSHVPGIDSDGCPYLRYTFTITNTATETLVIREVGYKQRVRVCRTPGRGDDSYRNFLFDRTLLDTPLVIEPGDAGVLVYTLKTIPRQERIVGGVKAVGFDWGTDEEIGAILDAASAGRVDLQSDIGWRVGDTRKIHLETFTDGADTTHAAQDIDIVITSFDEYNGCGNVMQFDFLECLPTRIRLHDQSTYANGYGATEIHEESLPAIAEALPAWLRGRLKTFSVVTATAPGSSATENVGNNKLALRSEMEIFGFQKLASAPEGEQVAFYQRFYDAHYKNCGYNGNTTYYALRSPFNANLYANPNSYQRYCVAVAYNSLSGTSSVVGLGDVDRPDLSNSGNNNIGSVSIGGYYIAPFGCV